MSTFSLCASAALSCGFHNYVPQPTLVDRLIASDHIVLARPDPSNPFTFKAVAALEGPKDGVVLPHLVDSATRHRLTKDEDAHVLFARDGAYGPWQRVAYVDDAMQPVLDHVVSHLPEWEWGQSGSRFAYFARLLEHADPTIRRLALLELDQAPYGALRQLDVSVDAGAMSARLTDITEVGLSPIRILLLGQSDDPSLAGQLHAGVDRNSVLANPLLGAYATAWVEHSGAEAARDLGASYLSDPFLPLSSRAYLVEALAIHAQVGDKTVQSAVRAAVSAAVEHDPALAPIVAQQFGDRRDWSMRRAVRKAWRRTDLKSATDIMTVTKYLAKSDGTSVSSSRFSIFQ